ncbi:MAG: hypothetical protein AB1640_08835 [bacterium]
MLTGEPKVPAATTPGNKAAQPDGFASRTDEEDANAFTVPGAAISSEKKDTRGLRQENQERFVTEWSIE